MQAPPLYNVYNDSCFTAYRVESLSSISLDEDDYTFFRLGYGQGRIGAGGKVMGFRLGSDYNIVVGAECTIGWVNQLYYWMLQLPWNTGQTLGQKHLTISILNLSF